MILVKKLKFLSSVLFFEQCLDMYFYDVVNRKEGFLDYLHFFQSLVKNLKFLSSLFFFIS